LSIIAYLAEGISKRYWISYC